MRHIKTASHKLSAFDNKPGALRPPVNRKARGLTPAFDRGAEVICTGLQSKFRAVKISSALALFQIDQFAAQFGSQVTAMIPIFGVGKDFKCGIFKVFVRGEFDMNLDGIPGVENACLMTRGIQQTERVDFSLITGSHINWSECE